MNIIKTISLTTLAAGFFLFLTACAPEVGSEAWCADIKATPNADLTTNQATDFAKHCIFK